MRYLFCFFTACLITAQPHEDLDQFIDSRMNSGYIPGLSACAIINDQIVWMNSYGSANLTLDIPVTNNTNFLLASISKLITTTAIMQIFENGDILLDDNINQYLSFDVINPFYPDIEITPYMLLTHTASIKEDLTFSEEYSIFGNNSEMELEYFLSNYFTPGAEFYSSNNFYNSEPGENWQYSNIGFALIALLVEHISNQSFEEYCELNIFEPLAMGETSWHFEGMDETNVAMPYEWMPGMEELGHYFIPYYPSAQLRSSVSELSTFLRAYMGYMESAAVGIGSQNNVLLADDTIELILVEHVNDGWDWNNMSEGWGLGWYYKIINGKEFWGHNGEMWGVLTELFFNKEDKLGIIILTNGGDYFGSWYNDVMAVEDSILKYVYKHISIIGELNFDGQINFYDMEIMIDYLFKETEFTELQNDNADLDYNENIDIYDLLFIIELYNN